MNGPTSWPNLQLLFWLSLIPFVTARYLIAIPAAFVASWIAGGLYVFVAFSWLAPDRRIERALGRDEA